MNTLSTWESCAVVLALGLDTFLIRYSFIGLFTNHDMPAWLVDGLKIIVPAIFAAIVASGVAFTDAAGDQWHGCTAHIACYTALAGLGDCAACSKARPMSFCYEPLSHKQLPFCAAAIDWIYDRVVVD
jgi:branched-subunit amino acid transport protein